MIVSTLTPAPEGEAREDELCAYCGATALLQVCRCARGQEGK